MCKTPGRVLMWMRFHIKNGDHGDKIQTPPVTLERGVCSYLEFAWLFHDVLNEMGINSYIVTVKGSSKSVACFFEDGNNTLKCMVNRWTIFRCHEHIDDAIIFIDEDWCRWIEWAVVCNKIVPVKPHYRDGKYGEDKDTRSYLLRNRLSSVRRSV